MKRFRLLRGTYAMNEPDPVDENGNPVVKENGEIERGKIRTFKGRNMATKEPGDIVESDVDLVARFGANKFEALDASHGPSRKNMLKMKTIAELREFAAEEEVDLGDLTKKADIVEAILDWIGE